MIQRKHAICAKRDDRTPTDTPKRRSQELRRFFWLRVTDWSLDKPLAAAYS
jgi:hypothetical protein